MLPETGGCILQWIKNVKGQVALVKESVDNQKGFFSFRAIPVKIYFVYSLCWMKRRKGN
jgi:hypothetical protein